VCEIVIVIVISALPFLIRFSLLLISNSNVVFSADFIDGYQLKNFC